MQERDDEVVILPLGEIVPREVTSTFTEQEFAQWWTSLSSLQREILSEDC